MSHNGKEGIVCSFGSEAEHHALFGVKLGPSTYGIFDAFADEARREAHLAGKVGAALKEKAAELFPQGPSIEEMDVLASKLR
jgi:hypothetical protein